MDTEISKNVMKSGTSIVGLVCKNGVVLAGDRRSTAGGIIMSKNSHKVVQVNDYIAVAGAGVASDIDMFQRIFAAELKLKELQARVRPSTHEAANLIGMLSYKTIRTPSMIPSIVGTLVAGFDEDGTAHLYTVEPAGGVYKVEDFDANFSSGMPYILGLLEKNYKKDLTIEQGVDLARDAIKAAIERDNASGNGIDVFTITKDGIKQVVSQKIVPTYN